MSTETDPHIGPRMGNSAKDDSIIEQLRAVIRDAVDYVATAMALAQARVAGLALSSAVFLALLLAAALLGGAAFIVLNVALGVWLAHLVGAGWSLVILGAFYAILAIVCAAVALNWLRRLRS